MSKTRKECVLHGSVDRREFLKVTTVAVAGLAGVPLVSRDATGAGPSKGGMARFGLADASTSDSLDPATMFADYIYTLSWGLRNNLVEVAANGEIVPELAESWEPSSDLTIWRFRLRQGVEFHNGKSMISEDVVASINHHRGETRSAVKSLLEDVRELSVDGKDVVEFRLNRPNADFPAILTAPQMNIMPVDDQGKPDLLGTGTGGYVLQSFEPGVRTHITRNPNYWKAERAHFEAVELIAINDGSARINALRTGDIDVMHRVETSVAKRVANEPNVEIINVPGARHYTAPMMMTMAPFDSMDLRLAVKYAIDREQIVENALNGYGTVGNDHPIGSTYKYHAADIPQRTYDPDKAKFYLKKAGYSTLKLTLHASTAPYGSAVDAAALMKEHANKAGIEIEIIRDPADGYWSNVWRKVPWCLSTYSGRATAGMILSYAYTSGAAANDMAWANERFDSLLSEALGTLDSTRRQELYRELQLMIRDQSGAIVYAFPALLDAVSEKVRHPEVVSTEAGLDGRRALERWWFS